MADPERNSQLLRAALDLTSHLNLSAALQRFVDQACHLTGARYGALSVLDNRGETSAFLQHGMTAEQERRMEHPPVGRGLIGAIPTDGNLIVNDVAHSPLFTGFPAGHPAMDNFLGVPVLVREQVYGRLYLCSKQGGFDETDGQIVEALAAAAGVAVENSELYAQARNRERWIAASQELTTAMLQGTDEENALALIARTVREVATADTVLIVLPSVGNSWACEIADGWRADTLLGLVFPPEGRAMSVVREGTGMIVDSLVRAVTMRVPELAAFGPALYAPLRSRRKRGRAEGVIILLRRPGKPEFDSADLPLAESLASQATLALELASARHAEDVANLLDERGRIGRDLHDFAIQQLFATGMQLDTTKSKIAEGSISTPEVIDALDASLSSIDEAVRQIRAIVHQLREPDQDVAVVERLRREASLSRNYLGFAPSLVISLDDHPINEGDEDAEVRMIDRISERVSDDIADDAVAVVREGLTNVARHAHATAAQVDVDVVGEGPTGELIIRVVDDGRGIDPKRTRSSGLGNLQVRARRHSGTFAIGSGPRNRGTGLVWRVPLSKASA